MHDTYLLTYLPRHSQKSNTAAQHAVIVNRKYQKYIIQYTAWIGYSESPRLFSGSLPV